MKKKVVPKIRQEVKVKVDIVTSDDIKIYYPGKLKDFTARYIINLNNISFKLLSMDLVTSSQRSQTTRKTYGVILQSLVVT